MVKNWALINWTMASEDLKEDWNKTADVNMNKFTIQGDYCSYKSIGTEYNYNLDCYNILFFSFSPSSSQGGSFPLYSPSWTLFTLHLLIIWVATWILVPSDTPSDLLWVVVAQATLFKSLLHVNAARKIVVMHLMRW